jgi:dihydrodipicolinate synthase/N-acetylneuraminate lyase
VAWAEPDKRAVEALRRGLFIVAHPLALTRDRKLDERRQAALTRYYVSSGAGGVAVGVHTTQFGVHNPKLGMYEPLLRLTAEVLDECERRAGRFVVRIAGIAGPTEQAVREARIARDLGYHAGMVELGSLRGASEERMIEHVKAVAREIPVFGFYMQVAIGGVRLPYSFWRRLFEEVENVVGVKVAPFNRYFTIDVARALVDSGREGEVALYTGNDDHIVLDLLTEFRFRRGGEYVGVRIVGGLLGHWAFWTARSVQVFETVKGVAERGEPVPPELLALANQITDANAAIFDAANAFKGVIPGIHEVLRRSGLLEEVVLLDPSERLSPGQLEEIDRVYRDYPHLRDDDFVKAHLAEWLEGEWCGEGYTPRPLTREELRAMVLRGEAPPLV